MPLGDLVDKAKETAKSAKDTTGIWIASGKEKLQEGITSATEETNRLIAVLKKSGFNIGNMTITIAANPKINLRVEDKGSGKKNLIKIVEKEESELSKLQLGTINALLMAYNLTDITSEHGYKFGHFDLLLTLPPQVTVHLVADK